MIGMRDALTLAHTKIRSKRLRLIITTIVSGLVFGVMAGATILTDGVGSSVDAFARKNLGGRFLVQGQPNVNAAMTEWKAPNDPTLVAEVTALNTAYIAERKAAAKRLGVEYDERSEIPAIVEDNSPNVPAEFRKQVNQGSVAYQRWVKANAAQRPATPDLASFRTLITTLGAGTVYAPRTLGSLGLTLLPGGKEDVRSTKAPFENNKELQNSGVAQGQFTVVPDELIKPFILAPNAERTTPKGIPVLVTAEEASALFGQALGLSKRPSDTAAQIEWVKGTRDKVNGATFVSCYRNQGERDLLEQARTQANEMETNKGNADYTAPALQYALPTTPCGAVTVAKDTRDAAQKLAEANQKAFEQEFHPTPAPRAELVTFQIVGLLPTGANSQSGLEAVVGGLVGMNYGYGAAIPEDSLKALPTELRHDDLLAATSAPVFDPMTGQGEMPTYIASFSNVDLARKAVQENSCTMNWTEACNTMPFMMSAYGTNYLAVDDITTQLRPVLIALLIIAFAIATIIIWAMMGRVIADSRRETAVFRAIGAKRSDIGAVYVTYSLWVALRIVVFAALLGGVIALVVNVLFAERATRVAQLAYGVFTPDPTFTFIGLGSPVLWLILGGIVVMSLIAITPPLLRNIRRNPIKDMRDE